VPIFQILGLRALNRDGVLHCLVWPVTLTGIFLFSLRYCTGVRTLLGIPDAATYIQHRDVHVFIPPGDAIIHSNTRLLSTRNMQQAQHVYQSGAKQSRIHPFTPAPSSSLDHTILALLLEVVAIRGVMSSAGPDLRFTQSTLFQN
jgi:hypothetical protein